MKCVTGPKRGVTACVILMTFGVALFASTTASRAQEHAPYMHRRSHDYADLLG